MIQDTLVIGTGLSAFSVVTSMDSLENVHIIDGNERMRSKNNASRNHLGLKTKCGSTHPFADPSSLNLLDISSNQLPASLSRGGLSEVWGNGFTLYPFSQLDSRDLINDLDVFRSMKELLDLMPHVADKALLDSRFREFQEIYALTDYEGVSSHPFFIQLNEELSRKTDLDFAFGRPFLFLNKRLCTSCGLCLSGCPYGALFDAGEMFNSLILSGKIKSTHVHFGVVNKLIPKTNSVDVEIWNGDSLHVKSFKNVILCAGPIPTAAILMRSNLIENEFKIPDSQIFYFAGLSMRRVSPVPELAEIGQLAVYPTNIESGDFQVGFYAPSKVSRERISSSLFRGPIGFLKVPKFISERLIPGIGFLPQESSGFLTLKLERDSIILTRTSGDRISKAAKNVVSTLTKLFSFTSLRVLKVSLRIPDPGSGFHIGGSMPFAGNHIDELGRLRVETRIKVMDASILPSIPAGAHTFMTMALVRCLIKKDS